MSSISLRSLTKRFGEVTAVDRLDLDLPEGELVALLGPSGCGKTTTLRMVAGFEMPTEGRILLGDRDVTGLPPERRDCGMVFQNYALFPHMTVTENVAFGLQMRRVPKADARQRVAGILEKVGLKGMEGRRPRQLSGGQQQRTALARALVINPAVLLLDEPLANLDAKLREEMRFYIRSLQREFRITTLYVTHDQAEALVLADRIAVMMDGRLQQLGSPEDLYRRPQSAAVAGFVGVTNLLPGRVVAVRDGEVQFESQAGLLRGRGPSSLPTNAEGWLSVRPEDLGLHAPGFRADDQNQVRGVVRERAFLGNLADYRVEVPGDLVLRIQAAPGLQYAPGDEVTVCFPANAGWSLPK
jgi:putative spermidine/putrescine transport system ATP-binding protein